jgi:signal transduction histidine kinase
MGRFSPRRWSIRVKSVMLALGYLLVLSVVYGAFTVHLLQREISQAHDRLRQTARIVAAEIDGALGAGGQRLETVSRLPGLAYGLQTIQETPRDGYIPPWTTLHYLFFKSTVFTGGVFLLDRAGTVLWTEPPGLPWLHQSLRDVAPVGEVFASGERRISGVVTDDRLASSPHVVLAVPIANAAGEVQGILGGVIDLAASAFSDLLRPVSTAEGRFVEVVDQHGTVLLATDQARRFGQVEPPAAGVEDPMRAVVTLSTAPWQVVAGQPPALGLRRVWRSQRALWGIGILLLLALGAVAASILNGFVRSIRRLTAAAETVARGDLSQPVEVGSRQDELATLGHAFEQMRVELGSSQRALEQRLGEREELIRMLVRSNEELVGTQARLIEAERFAAIGELSAAVAHGIRNPVAGIKMAAQLASLELPPEDPLRQNVDDIITEADKLESRISTLLDFAKPFEPKPERCRLERIVGEVVASLRNLAGSRGVALTAELASDLPAVELDEAQIEQVLLDLVSNAIEATPAGGRVSLAGRLTEDGERVRLLVTDTGTGITPNNMGRVFKLFFTTKPNGTGFGLAVAKKIIERHGGTIAVASEVGAGTRFTIELPLRSPALP